MIWLLIGLAAFLVVLFCVGLFFLFEAVRQPCVEGCFLDMSTGVMSHSPVCPNHPSVQ